MKQTTVAARVSFGQPRLRHALGRADVRAERELSSRHDAGADPPVAGAPAVVGIPRGSVLGPLRVVIGAPADSPDVIWLYPADGAQPNAWMVLNEMS